MLDIAFKDFKAKKGRAAMCIVGVMACVLLIGVVNVVMYDMQNSLKGDLGTVNGLIFFEQNGTGYPPAGSIVPQSVGDEVMNRSEINPAESTPALFAPLQGAVNPEGGTPIMVVGVPHGKEHVYLGNNTADGKNSLEGEATNAVIIGNETAKRYNVTLGDTFKVGDNEFKVAGIIPKVGSGWALTMDSSMIMDLSYAQNVTSRPGLISTVMIKPNAGYGEQSVQDNLEGTYNKYSVFTQKDIQKTLDNSMKGVFSFMNMVVVMIFAVSVVLIMNVMMMSVKEKTKDIGTMRALGTGKRSILKLVIYESLILSGIGGIIGILLISPVYSVLGWLLGAEGIQFYLPTAVLVQVALIVLVIGTLSGLIPAYQATRISPIEALRYE